MKLAGGSMWRKESAGKSNLPARRCPSASVPAPLLQHSALLQHPDDRKDRSNQRHRNPGSHRYEEEQEGEREVERSKKEAEFGLWKVERRGVVGGHASLIGRPPPFRKLASRGRASGACGDQRSPEPDSLRGADLGSSASIARACKRTLSRSSGFCSE
jgi:hypothetical protein